MAIPKYHVEWLKLPGILRNRVKARAYHKEISLKCDKIVRK